ncbi:MAG TPA: hypothetical protein VLT36_19115, partial [Candidatus Dormibacteraeota bacterium]|nr:hypothetical protein [Candidatus Dormibacteraeota bacterium]
MKYHAFIAMVPFSLCAIAFSQESQTNALIKLTAAEAKDHIGTNAVVTGTVAEIYKGPRTVNLNFDKPFPKHTFSAVIFSDKTNLFPELDKLKDKTVEVTGKILDYRNRAEIVLSS